ncbi:hypothetical protein SFRURICE_004559 [Spodoptera frugiperda]|nr:hypothetical protein SFRURICE_004559 [Spodoptera frugiperda]
MGLITQMVKSGCTLYGGIKRRNIENWPDAINMPRWSSGRNCDYGKGSRIRFRVGQSFKSGFFRFSENFSVVARSLELCPGFGNMLTHYYMGLIT